MRKIIKGIFLFIFAVIAISLYSKVEAASAKVTANKTSATVGDSVKVTVTINAAAWNVNVSGSASDSIVGFNNDAVNQTTTKSYSINTIKAGTYKVSISGDITDESSTKAEPVNQTVSITVKAKTTNTGNSSSSSSNSSSSSGSSTSKPSTSTTTTPKFTSVKQTVYATDDGINVRASYSTSSAAIGSLKKGESLKRTGIATTTINGIKWSKVTYNGQTAYVSSAYLTTTKPVVEEPKKEEPKVDNTTKNEISNNGITNNNEISNNINTEKPVENNEENNVTNTQNEELKLSKLEIVGVNFSDGFDPDKHSYGLQLNFFVKSLDITAEANKENAKVEIIGNENFIEGDNNVTILLTSEEETATYQIKVTVPSEVATAPQNNIQFYIMCGSIILVAIAIIAIITVICKKANNSSNGEFAENNNEKVNLEDSHKEQKNKKEKAKGKHSN